METELMGKLLVGLLGLSLMARHKRQSQQAHQQFTHQFSLHLRKSPLQAPTRLSHPRPHHARKDVNCPSLCRAQHLLGKRGHWEANHAAQRAHGSNWAAQLSSLTKRALRVQVS